MKVERLPYFPSYERQKSFLSCGILLDDVSNYVLLYHVAGVQKNGSYHKVEWIFEVRGHASSFAYRINKAFAFGKPRSDTLY